MLYTNLDISFRYLANTPDSPTMSAAPAEAIELKNKGNEAFKNKDWPTALEYYTKAIEKYDQEPSFYTNRAQVSKSGGSCFGPH